MISIEQLHCNPKPAAAYVGRGIVNASRGNSDQAIMDYNRAIEVAPGFVAAYTNRGTRQL